MSKYPDATQSQIDEVMQDALKAFETYKNVSGKLRATFLRAIADEIDALGDKLIKTASEETHLPEARIRSERDRTTGHCRMFADLVEEGSWVDARIDPALPDRKPKPRVDLRKMLVPIGPVVVFGASNFPLAYSTAGGDTASALAAGCPVVVKAHPGHAETSTLVAGAIGRAASKVPLPSGVFHHVYGASIEVGKELVTHPHVRAVGFTGSFVGGKALFDLANNRSVPIPVFAEMGSINPVFILPGALKKRGEAVAALVVDSFTQGVGQFCTNPGILLGAKSDELHAFAKSVGEKVKVAATAEMLHEGIASNYKKNRANVLAQGGVTLVAEADDAGTNNMGRPTFASVGLTDFVANPKLAEEVFGPFSMLIEGEKIEELDQALDGIPGQLTASIIGEDDELEAHRAFIDRVREKAGRLIINGVPTGVEVCPAMQHGGPFPATTDSRFTSVGTDAIKRFARPLCFQNFPDTLLPEELKDKNPMKIWRTVNGKLEK